MAETRDWEDTMARLQKSFLSVGSAASTTSNIFATALSGSFDVCSSCKHETKHHNPDKRMKSGYGMCVCGNCKKYVSNFIELGSNSFAAYIVSGSSNYHLPPQKTSSSVSVTVTMKEISSDAYQTVGDMAIQKALKNGLLSYTDTITSISQSSQLYAPTDIIVDIHFTSP